MSESRTEEMLRLIGASDHQRISVHCRSMKWAEELAARFVAGIGGKLVSPRVVEFTDGKRIEFVSFSGRWGTQAPDLGDSWDWLRRLYLKGATR